MFDKNPLVNLGRLVFLLLLLAFTWQWAVGIMLVLLIPVGFVGAIVGVVVMLFAPAKG